MALELNKYQKLAYP